MRKAGLVSLGVAIVLAGAAFSFVLWHGAGPGSASVAFAQGGPTATPTSPANGTQPDQGAKTDMLNAFWTALASKLGITVDNLKTGVVAAEKDVIEQAVTSGRLTRAQADQLEQRLSTNAPLVPFFGGPRGGAGGPGYGPHGAPIGGVNTLEAIATVLNMKPADLSAQLQSGKTLADIAAAQNVDQSKVKQAIVDSVKVQIQREVQDGLITQAQADQRLANLTPDNIDLTRGLWLGGAGPGRFPQRGYPRGGSF
jgi:hypothetical protein